MDILVALILFSALGAVICARARAAGPALFFGVVAVALFAATPLGAELPGAVTAMFEAFDEAATSGGAQ